MHYINFYASMGGSDMGKDYYWGVFAYFLARMLTLGRDWVILMLEAGFVTNP